MTLEETVAEIRESRLEKLRLLNVFNTDSTIDIVVDRSSLQHDATNILSKDDPILQWSCLHQSVNIKESQAD